VPWLQDNPGAQRTCFTSTKVQVLTTEELSARASFRPTTPSLPAMYDLFIYFLNIFFQKKCNIIAILLRAHIHLLVEKQLVRA
jgi:hypothetical protein